MRSNRTPDTWDPRTVLEIGNDGRCVGWSREGKRCCFGIAKNTLAKAQRDMEIIGASSPTPAALHQKLLALAKKLVCKRYHRDEEERVALLARVVEVWEARVANFAAAQAEKRREMREKARSRQHEHLLVELLSRVSIGHLAVSSASSALDNPPAYAPSSSSDRVSSVGSRITSSSKTSSSSASLPTGNSDASYAPSLSSSSDTVMADYTSESS